LAGFQLIFIRIETVVRNPNVDQRRRRRMPSIAPAAIRQLMLVGGHKGGHKGVTLI
jgi:hypothetical protein